MILSRAETIGAFNTGFDTANLHRPAMSAAAVSRYHTSGDSFLIHSPHTHAVTVPVMERRTLKLKAKFESAS